MKTPNIYKTASWLTYALLVIVGFHSAAHAENVPNVVARPIGKFVDEIGVDKFSLYLMDYGAPVGFRIATARPDRVETLIVQNGNAYSEGIDNNFWEPIKAYWKDRVAVNQGLDNDRWKNVKAAYKQPAMSQINGR